MFAADDLGKEMVLLARNAVTNYLSGSEQPAIPSSSELLKAGTFVTIYRVNHKKQETLRGCIGFPVPAKPLGQSIIDSALAAAFEDPRFPPLEFDELEDVTFEVSILTEPIEISGEPKERASRIVIGRDGLILRWKYGSGLLLPQVAVELNWTLADYLVNICGKAGAPLDEWSKSSSKLYTFQARVFKETEPNGMVRRLEL